MIFQDNDGTSFVILCNGITFLKGLPAIAKLKPLSLFISLLVMLKKAFEHVKI